MTGISNQPGMRSPATTAAPPADFNPLDWPELINWWDFSDASTLFSNTAGTIPAGYGEGVKSVRSKGPAGDLPNQNAAVFIRTAAVQNGLDAVVNAGTTWFNGGGGTPVMGVVCVVSHTPDLVLGAVPLIRSGTSSNRISFGESQGLFNQGSPSTLADWPTARTGVNLYAVMRGYSGGTVAKFWRNNLPAVSVSAANAAISGASRNFGGSGTFCEMFTFSATVPETDVQLFLNYLSAKWATPTE